MAESMQHSIEKSGLGLLLPDKELLDKVVVSAESEVMEGGTEKGEEELRGEIESQIYKLTMEQAEIEGGKKDLEGAEEIGGVEGGFEGEVKRDDLGEEGNVDVVVCVERGIESDVGKDDLGEGKEVGAVGSGVEKGDLGEEEKIGDVVVDIEGDSESDLGKVDLGEEQMSVDVVEGLERDFESRVEKDDLGEEKSVSVVKSVEGDSEKKAAGLTEEKILDVVKSVEGDYESRVEEAADLGEEKNVDVVKSVGDSESRVEKATGLGEEKNVTVVEGLASQMERDDLDEEKGGNAVQSEEKDFASEIGQSDLSKEKNGDVVESVEGAFAIGVVEGGWELTGDFNDREHGFAKSIDGENENGVGDEDSVGDQTGEDAGKVARSNQNNARRRSNFPMRPDAEDCTYYMKFATCKFGLNCKFNHPPKRKTQGIKEKTKPGEENPERMGQTECKYHMTPVGCKYGKNCKYYHGSENNGSISLEPELNFLGLPIRLGEKECPYYMRTGSCKYGSNCRFHHPEPTTVGGGDPGYGNSGSLPSNQGPASTFPSWSSPRAFNDPSPYSPAIYPQSHNAAPPNSEWNPSANTEWNGYQGPAYQTSERGLPTPPAFAMKNLTTEINFPLRPLNMMVVEYPERPGEPECSFFMKTGDCKYKSGCKFNHPKNRGSKAKAKGSQAPYTLSDKGLPLRPDQPICSHYHQYGICKYGPACRYDHPSSGIGLLPAPIFNQPPPFGGPDKSRKVNKTGIAL